MKLNNYIDLQVNGYKGVNFSAPNLNLDDIRRVSISLAEKGVAAYCPTIVTSSEEVYRHNLPLIAASAVEDGPGAKVLGVHIEGPFLNPEPGARGIHQARYIKKPDINFYRQLEEWCKGTQAIITIAPDQPDATELIHYITTTSNTVVSLGHHVADHDQIEAAVQAGAKAVTHFGNGIPDLLHRHKNPLWAMLADDRLYTMFIADGFHLPPDLIKVLLKIKPPDKLILTSDLMEFGGLAPGNYSLDGLDIVLESSGKLHPTDSSQLAGASLSIDQCSTYLEKEFFISREQLFAFTYKNPLQLLHRTL